MAYTEDDWQLAKVQARSALIDRAKAESPIAYSQLVVKIRAIRFEPDSPEFAKLLGEISEEEDAAGRGMLTVLVVHKGGDLRPGLGFYELAERLGKDVSDRERLWVEQFRKVCDAWKPPARRRS